MASWSFMLFALFVYFWVSSSVFFIWLMLEIMTWSIFFFFSINWSKTSQQNLFIFFMIQSLSSIIWLSSQYLTELFLNSPISMLNTYSQVLISIMILSIFFKMGFFPGHIWAWQIYNSLQYWPVLMMSTFHKIIPIMILFNMYLNYFGSSFEVFLMLLLIISFFLVLINIWFMSSFYSFLFLSGILNYSLMITIFTQGEIFVSSVYVIVYWVVFLLSFFILVSNYFSFFNPKSQNRSDSSIFFLIALLSISGFPPTSLFFFKLFFFGSMKHLFISLLSVLILMTSFFYLFFVFYSVLKKILTTDLNFESGKNVSWGSLLFLEDLYYFLSISTISWGSLLFLL